MIKRTQAAVNHYWQSFLTMMDPTIKAMINFWQAFTKKINPAIAKIEATTLGGPLVRGARNVGNSLYHLGSAVKHVATGVLDLAKLCFQSFKALFVAGLLASVVIAAAALIIVINTTVNVFSSVKASVKALFGIKEKNVSPSETALTTQNSQDNSELLVGELGSPRVTHNAALAAEQRYQQEQIRLRIISDSAGKTIDEGIKKIFASEKIIAERPDQVEDQEAIMKDVLLYEIYQPGKALVMQFMSALNAGIMAGGARRDNSRTTITPLPDDGVERTNMLDDIRRPNSRELTHHY